MKPTKHPMTPSIQRLVELIHSHPHAHTHDRAESKVLSLEGKGRAVINIEWAKSNPQHVAVNGHVVKCLWLIRAAEERHALVSGNEDRIGSIVDEFTWEQA